LSENKFSRHAPTIVKSLFFSDIQHCIGLMGYWTINTHRIVYW